jgi:electron transfer flavoprotein beta subunit
MATAYTLSKAVVAIGGCDLVLCGKHAIDGDTAQVGPGLAFRLGCVFVTGVRRIRKDEDNPGFFVVERNMDYGYDVVKLPLPALLTVSDEINKPRLSSLKGRMRAKKAEIIKLSASDIGAEKDRIGLAGSPTRVVEVFAPKQSGDGEVLSGSLEERVDQLVLRMEPYLR